MTSCRADGGCLDTVLAWCLAHRVHHWQNTHPRAFNPVRLDTRHVLTHRDSPAGGAHQPPLRLLYRMEIG